MLKIRNETYISGASGAHTQTPARTHIHMYIGRIFTLLPGSTALHFMTTSASPAARRIWILLMNQHVWRPITFAVKLLQFTEHRCWKCCPSTCKYLCSFIKKNTGTIIVLALTTHQTPTFAGCRGLDVSSGNSSSDYLCSYVSLQVNPCFNRKRMSIADWSYLRQQTVGTNCKN
jgi:hypothetical protein